jgi:hypothetical protein
MQYQNNANAAYGYSSVEIVRIIMQETGTYNTMMRRPFESHLTGSVQNTIVENCEMAGRITPNLLTGVAGQFIRPSATPERPINIVNGWETRRFKFFMEVRSTSHMGNVITQFITGYTDQLGSSVFGSLDPDMEFFINTVNIAKNAIRTTPMGSQNIQSIVDCSHLLYQNDYNGVHGLNNGYKMRPEDVFASMQNAQLEEASNLYGGSSEFVDTRTHLTRNPVKAMRRFNSSPVFVSSVLDSYVQTKRAAIGGSSELEITDSAAASVASARTNEDPFLRTLKGRTDSNGGSFRLRDLLNIDPTVKSRIVVTPMTPALRATLPAAGQSQHWQNSDYDTQFATALSQAVPGYMLDNCLQSVKFRATNMEMGGAITVILVDFGSLLQGIDISPYLASFSFSIEKTVLSDLSHNNMIPFSLEMSCNLMSESTVNLSVNGSPYTLFVSPCFCDGLMSPLVTADKNRLNLLAKDISTVVDYLGDATGSVMGFAETTTENFI